ncbi:DUF5808 domain-containing protein [Streptomyces sp. NPDC094034]|uniref:DUF1648 domain-containing protein n=1 Tax=Streptomyces sp. NPDC094034 TaxID=3155309 RepID=UPI00332AD8D7
MLVNLLVNAGILLPLGATLYAAPSPLLNPHAVPFGVRVPPDRADAPEVSGQRRRYRALLLPATLVVTVAALVIGAVLDSVAVGGVAALVLCAIAAALWLSAHRALARAKERGDWYKHVRQGVATDTSLRTDPVRLPWAWTIPSLVVIVVTAVAGAIAYPRLPATMALPERTSSGTEYREITTTFWTVFSPVFAQILLTAVVIGTLVAVLRARADLDVSRPLSSAARHRRHLGLTGRCLLGIAALLNLMLLGLSGMMWSDNRSGAVLSLVIGVPLLAAVAACVPLLRNGSGGSRPASEASGGADSADSAEGSDGAGGRDGGDEGTGLVPRDDDRHWYGAGTVYVNVDDPAVLVPRRVGMGWTVNLGNPRFLIISAAVLAIAAGATVVTATV